MLFRCWLLLIMFMFATSVTSIEDSYGSKEVRHHQPSAEYYNPIPVAVVYEDSGENSGKSHINTKTSDSNESVIENVTSEENVQTTTERIEKVTVAEENVNSKTKLKLVPKPRVLQDFQIPVAVVYESDPESTQNTYKSDAGTLKQPPSNSRELESKTNVYIVNKKITPRESKIDTESPEGKETRTFKKRTGARQPVVPIIESENYVFSQSGNFHYRYEGGDGTIAYSEGKLKKVEDEAGAAVVGGYSYTDKDGNDFSLSYTADENGYRPVGAHLPTPPPIPPAIARALEYLATATPEPVTKRPVKLESIVK